jgi:DNA-binding beta-propeller fold protein YncE
VADSALTATKSAVTVLSAPLPSDYEAVAVDSTNNEAYVALGNDSGGTVSTINLSSGKNARTTAHFGGLVTDLALSGDGSRLYIPIQCGCAGGSVAVLDTQTNQVTNTIDIGGSAYTAAVSPNHQLIFVTGYSPQGTTFLNFIESANQRVVAKVPVAPQQTAIAVSPSGATVYLASEEGGGQSKLEVVNVAEARVVATIDEGRLDACELAANPNGKTVYESICTAGSPNFALRVLDTKSNSLTSVRGTEAGARAVVISDDGRYALVAGPYGIGLVDAATNKLASTIPLPLGNYLYLTSLSVSQRNGRLLYAAIDYLTGPDRLLALRIPVDT